MWQFTRQSYVIIESWPQLLKWLKLWSVKELLSVASCTGPAAQLTGFFLSCFGPHSKVHTKICAITLHIPAPFGQLEPAKRCGENFCLRPVHEGMFVDLVFAHRYFKNHGANVSDLSFCDGPSGNSRQKLQEQGWNSRLFYFSGHGSGGEIIKDARPIGTLTIVLDCCYAGSLRWLLGSWALGPLLLPNFQQTRHTGYTNKEMSSRVWWSICAFLPCPMPPPWTSLGMVLPGRALACAMDFSLACALGLSLACALDLLWAKTWSKTDQYCVAGALLCMWGKSGSEGGGLSLTCVAPFAETGTPCIVYLLPCLHVAGVTLSSSYITLVWQCGCKSLWLNVIILRTCQWTSPFCFACESTLTSHPTPPHITPPQIPTQLADC